MDPITVYACESQPIAIEGLERVLERNGDLSFAGYSAQLTTALDDIRRVRPHVLLIDQSFGLKAIFEFVSVLRSEKLRCESIVWATDLSEVETFRAFQLGIRGVLRKTLPIERLIDCIRQVFAGSVWLENATHAAGLVQRRDSARLTPREREVVRLVCRGLKNKQIAETLRITPGTVKVHLMHVFEKTGLKDRYSLAMHGWDFPVDEKEIRLKPEGGRVDQM